VDLTSKQEFLSQLHRPLVAAKGRIIIQQDCHYLSYKLYICKRHMWCGVKVKLDD